MGRIIYNRDSLPKVRPSDFHVFECYLEEGRKKIFACNLLTFAYGIFNRAEVIKKLDLIASMHESGEARDQKKAIEHFGEALLDSLIDSIRIGVCFENYFKARLLLNDILIHSVDHNKNRLLAKEQRGRPVEVKEIISQRTAAEVPILRELLKDQTINYSTILDVTEYTKLLTIPSDTLKFLQDKNIQRNKLHLHIGETFILGDFIISQYKALRTMVNRDLAILQNELLDKTDPGSPSRIKVQL